MTSRRIESLLACQETLPWKASPDFRACCRNRILLVTLWKLNTRHKNFLAVLSLDEKIHSKYEYQKTGQWRKITVYSISAPQHSNLVICLLAHIEPISQESFFLDRFSQPFVCTLLYPHEACKAVLHSISFHLDYRIRWLIESTLSSPPAARLLGDSASIDRCRSTLFAMWFLAYARP